MSSNVKEAVAEQAIVLAATRLRVPVWRPVSEHGRADLVLDIGEKLWRVQVEWGQLTPARDVVIVRIGTFRRTAHGYIRSTYSEGELDLFGVYCGELDRCFLLPAQLLANKTCVSLRLTAPRNGQQSCINLADDFTFDGAVAQLARARDWQSRGRGFESPQLHSNPRVAPVTVPADSCRMAFGYWLARVAAGQDAVVTRRGRPIARLTADVRAARSRTGAASERLENAAESPPGPATAAQPFASTTAAAGSS